MNKYHIGYMEIQRQKRQEEVIGRVVVGSIVLVYVGVGFYLLNLYW